MGTERGKGMESWRIGGENGERRVWELDEKGVGTG